MAANEGNLDPAHFSDLIGQFYHFAGGFYNKKIGVHPLSSLPLLKSNDCKKNTYNTAISCDK